MVIFSQDVDVFFGKTRKMFKTPLKQSIRVPNFAQKNLHARVSLRRLKLLWKREPPLKWGTDPQIFVTTKRHAKRILKNGHFSQKFEFVFGKT